MIRRRDGDSFLLIRQTDHAELAGRLAERYGNAQFQPPRPREAVLTATRLHDAGWPLHDERPTLNEQRIPLDVFEVPRPIALEVWSSSADRAESADPYAGLLVSMHVLALSMYATVQSPAGNKRFNVQEAREQFEVSRFQHNEVERQENLRKKLGLRVDIPLKFGVAAAGATREDDELTFNFRILQAMDLTSLALCCTRPPVGTSGELHPSPGATPVKLNYRRDGNVLVVDPWPFDQDEIPFSLPCRRIPVEPFTDEGAFVEAYNAAAVEHLTMSLRRG